MCRLLFIKMSVLWMISTAICPSTIENEFLKVQLDVKTGQFSIRDKRTGYTWRQNPNTVNVIKTMTVFRRTANEMQVRCEFQTGHNYVLTFELDENSPELTVSLDGKEMREFLPYPYPFLPEEDADILLAIQSGLLFPVTDNTVYFENTARDSYYYYAGHTGSMPFYGLINKNGDGLMRLVETPNDAGFRLLRYDGRLINQIRWQPQFDQLGYTRKLRYILFEQGGYVSMADRFRTYAEQEGMVKTLREKALENPNVDKLVGAASLWIQDYYNTVDSTYFIAQEMAEMGMPRMIFNGRSGWWNNMTTADIINVNALGYLSGRYDIYSDVFDTNRLSLVNINPSWPLDAWPHHIIMNKDGTFLNGWATRGKDGNSYYCNLVTELFRVQYARERISVDLETKPYLARFIDTEGASAWVEDYNPEQPMTRTQCRGGRAELLSYVSNEAGVITGTEGLQCFSVPYVHYFEGVGPIEPFRFDIAGNDIFKNFEFGFEFEPELAKLLEISHRYFVPLWDLVFHDCVVVYPRWEIGVRNKFPTRLWVEKGTLQNVLYGRPPLFTITPDYWESENGEYKQLIKQIYDAECSVARKTGYSRMISHEFLTADKDVQRTEFDNGVVITVNFGDDIYQDDCEELAPWSYHIKDSVYADFTSPR